MVVARRRFLAMVEAVTRLQGRARGWLVRRGLARQRQAAFTIQQRVRSTREAREARRRYLELRSSVVVVQSMWRMVRQRREYREEVRRVVLCQAAVRGKMDRQRFLKTKQAAIVLQRRWRAAIQGK